MAGAIPTPLFAGLQILGAWTAANGARAAAAAQKEAISSQAQLELINSRSNAISMNGQADIDLINTKSALESKTFDAQFNEASTTARNFANEASASLSLQSTENSASLGILKAENQAAAGMEGAQNQAAADAIRAGSQADGLRAGAQIDSLNAGLYEMQAQSALLHGQYQEQDSRMQYAQAKSHAITTMARGGIDMSEGTSLMVRTGIDVLSERAAIQVQQNALMSAFGARAQEAGAMVSATSKQVQADSLLSMSRLGSDLNINSARFTGQRAIAEAELSGDVSTSAAKLNSTLTSISDSYQSKLASSQSEWTAAMVKAGLASAEATSAYKKTMAQIGITNAEAAYGVKMAGANGISPSAAFSNSLLGSAGQVAGSWYAYSKAFG